MAEYAAALDEIDFLLTPAEPLVAPSWLLGPVRGIRPTRAPRTVPAGARPLPSGSETETGDDSDSDESESDSDADPGAARRGPVVPPAVAVINPVFCPVLCTQQYKSGATWSCM